VVWLATYYQPAVTKNHITCFCCHQPSIKATKMERTLQQKIFRNALLSLFIYALPIILMLITFYFSGQRPWLKQSDKNNVSSTKLK
jgi:hypothetical protein